MLTEARLLAVGVHRTPQRLAWPPLQSIGAAALGRAGPALGSGRPRLPLSRPADSADAVAMLKYLVTGVLLLVGGLVGVVVHSEQARRATARANVVVPDEAAEIATISTGEEVDVGNRVPRNGFTLVEFTADF